MIPAAQRVALGGLLRGRELAGEAMVSLDDDALSLDTARGRITFALAKLEGIRVPGDVIELYLSTGDVIQLERAPELQRLATAITASVCAVPEMTRSLRALGAGAHAGGEEHDQFFAPLLEARVLAERAPNLVALRAAFDAVALRASAEQVIQELAAGRYPSAAGERRALAAELSDAANELFVRVAQLEQAESVLGACDDSERFVRWRAWADALRDVFRGADTAWIAMHPVLSDDRRARESWLRRIVRRRRARRRS